MTYKVVDVPGRKTSYSVKNAFTGQTICGTYSNQQAANHIVMCLNLYEDLKATNKLDAVMKMLDEDGL